MSLEKECYACKTVKPLSDFDESTKPYVLKIKYNLGHNLSCKECTVPEVMKKRILACYSERNQDWWID